MQLEDMPFLTFLMDTYEIRIPEDLDLDECSLSAATHPGDHTVDIGPTGRYRPYLIAHPEHKVRCRVLETPGYERMVGFVGRLFPPSPITGDLFLAAVLALVKPWRSLRFLWLQGETWKETYERHMSSGAGSADWFVDTLRQHHGFGSPE
jgi:hypothetical protein